MREPQYVRAIERLWSELLERPVVLSPRDWDRIRGWYARAIPLAIVREAIEELARPRRGGRQRRPPRDLGAIERAVDQSWEVVTQGRAVKQPASAPHTAFAPAAGTDLWPARTERVQAGSGTEALLLEAAERLAAGEAVTVIDRDVDLRLRDTVPADWIVEIEADVQRELAAVRGRMSPATLRQTQERAVCERLRRRLGLPPSAAPSRI